MLSLRLNARVIAAMNTASLAEELRYLGAPQEPGILRHGDVAGLALERLGPPERDALRQAVHDTPGVASHLVAPQEPETGGRVLLIATRSALKEMAALLERPRLGQAALAAEIRQALDHYDRRRFDLRLKGRRLTVGPRPALMGVVNVTPDSFSDGGRHFDRGEAIAHGCRLAEEGADIIDVGGESTRPRSDPVSEDEELSRVLPVIEGLASRTGTAISIDTRRARVAREAVGAGASLINDVTALQGDPAMAGVAAETGAGVALMHMLGEPKTMQDNPRYDHLMADICRRLRRGIEAARAAGVPEDALLVDPGIGFGKTLVHNVAILAQLGQLRTLGRPILIGVSRKRFIGQLTGVETPAERTYGTAAACALAVAAGALVLRVHDVGPMRQAVAVASAIVQAGEEAP